jgi:hypothetical protein
LVKKKREREEEDRIKVVGKAEPPAQISLEQKVVTA